MQLPENIWRRRLESELLAMQQSGEKFEISPDKTTYIVSLHGEGLVKDGDNIAKRDNHSIEIDLLREYPYPGGIALFWLSPIFHPNIRAEDGAVCIQLINEWSETQTIVSVVKALKQMLANPNPQSPLNQEAANYFLQNPQLPQQAAKGPRLVKI